MEQLTTTPFGRRPVTAGLMKHVAAARAEAPLDSVDKWQIFRALCTAKAVFGVRDRDLTVLNALLSFRRDATLDDGAAMIVYPSNATLAARAHGMAESTLRRHLAALVQAGLLLRHDSPNGKRYARRDATGEVIRAFGFDLRPLLARAGEILQAATRVQEAAQRVRMLREEAVLFKRDAEKLIAYAQAEGLPGNWDELSDRVRLVARGFRRKLAEADVMELRGAMAGLLEEARSRIETENMSGSDSHSGRHIQNSKPDSFESELPEKREGQAADVARTESDGEWIRPRERDNPLPLRLVLTACPEVFDHAPDGIRHWPDLVRLAQDLRGMMGISEDAWLQACRAMGPETAAVTVVCILQRFAQIRNHGGYLRALSQRAEEGAFSPGPMVMALLKGQKVAA